MTNVFLIPGSEKHLKSVEDGVSIDLIKEFLKEEERRRLEEIYKDGKIRVWGVLPTKKLKSMWDKMEENDILLFAISGTGYYKYYGKIAFKSHNKDLSKRLQEIVWEKEGEKYEYIFYVKNLQKINLSKEVINEIAGYRGTRIPIYLMKVKSPVTTKKIIDLLKNKIVSHEKLPLKYSINHLKLMDMLVELSRFYGYYYEKEYSYGPYRYDVIWKRTKIGSPTKVFEVHHKGILDSALAKLKHAYDIWNAKLFLVITSHKDKDKANFLLTGSFHEIGKVTTILQPEEIMNLYRYKEKFKEIEEKLK